MLCTVALKNIRTFYTKYFNGKRIKTVKIYFQIFVILLIFALISKKPLIMRRMLNKQNVSFDNRL